MGKKTRSPAPGNELLTTYALTLLKSFTASSTRSASDSLILGAERTRGGFFGPTPPLPTLDSFHDKIVPTASPPLVLPRPVSLADADGDGGLGNQFKDEEQALARITRTLFHISNVVWIGCVNSLWLWLVFSLLVS